MADVSLYLSSLQSLSTALEKGIALLNVNNQIRLAYESIPSKLGNDSKALLDSLLVRLPDIAQLQSEEKVLKASYSEYISKTINSMIAFILTIERADLAEVYITGLQKHLQIIINVLSSSPTISQGNSYTVNQEAARAVLPKLLEFRGIPQADNLIEKIKRVFLFLGLNYVG